MQTIDLPAGPALQHRAQAVYESSLQQIHVQTDRLFANLMILQWLAGIAAAIWISPRTWIGATSTVNLHVWAAIFLGGVISGYPVFLAWKHPGRVMTRHAIAVGQTLTSALLIHLTGGRIETHFHVFGSLAFLAFYRDWRVLVTATVVVGGDHLVRGLYWPQSVFGVLTPSSWRWLEHVGWVLFEDAFLFISIRQSLRQMFEIALRRAGLENLNAQIELQVVERTAALEKTNAELRTALANVKELSGLLPICSYCKKVRDDQDYWQTVEGYISHHTDATFSHGICPECYNIEIGRIQCEHGLSGG